MLRNRLAKYIDGISIRQGGARFDPFCGHRRVKMLILTTHMHTWASLETANVKGKIKRQFSKSRPTWAKFWRFWRSAVQGFYNVLTFTAKGTSLRGCMLFKLFCVKIG